MTPEREGEVSLYGKTLSNLELRRRTGRLGQAFGVEPFVFDDGPARGVRAMRVRAGGGLAFEALTDRGMDLGTAEYRGVPLAWLSPNGVVAPQYYEPEDEGWLRSFGGGLLVTCGLQNVGNPSGKDGEPLGLHGRISNLPASNVSHDAVWDEDGCVLEVRGMVRENRVFGADLALHRTITVRAGESRIRIEDKVTNEGFDPQPLMLLYHINLGWPLLDEGSRLISPGQPGKPPEPRDEEARTGLETWGRFDAPTPGFRERVFHHHPVADEAGWAEARLENPVLGLAFTVRFRPDELPEMAQWTMTGEGTYTVGLEPATCRVGGHEAEQEAGRVLWLEPGESRRFRVELEVSEIPGG
ncbi:MAG: aldose 1-epimerase family protein [Rubrobacter sp.]|nr:aldose 1-epimerase family protein [Rubrobacter sp.]